MHLRLRFAFWMDAFTIVAVPVVSLYAAFFLGTIDAWKTNLALEGVVALMIILHAVLLHYLRSDEIALMVEMGPYTLLAQLFLGLFSYVGIGIFAPRYPNIAGAFLGVQMLALGQAWLLLYICARMAFPEMEELQDTGTIDLERAR